MIGVLARKVCLGDSDSGNTIIWLGDGYRPHSIFGHCVCLDIVIHINGGNSYGEWLRR